MNAPIMAPTPRANHKIFLAAPAGLEFEIAGQSYRVPAPNRSQMNRALALEAPPSSEKGPSVPERLPDAETRFAMAPERFAMGMAPGGEADADLESVRAAQFTILVERSEPALPIESLSPVEREQVLVALVSFHFQMDPAQAAATCGAILASTPALQSSMMPPS